MSKQDLSLLVQKHCFIFYSKSMSRRLMVPWIELSDCKSMC